MVLAHPTDAAADRALGPHAFERPLKELPRGRPSPAHAGTKSVLRESRRTIEDMPAHRISSPSETAMGEAGMLAGLVVRFLGPARTERRPLLLNDASLERTTDGKIEKAEVQRPCSPLHVVARNGGLTCSSNVRPNESQGVASPVPKDRKIVDLTKR